MSAAASAALASAAVSALVSLAEGPRSATKRSRPEARERNSAEEDKKSKKLRKDNTALKVDLARTQQGKEKLHQAIAALHMKVGTKEELKHALMASIKPAIAALKAETKQAKDALEKGNEAFNAKLLHVKEEKEKLEMALAVSEAASEAELAWTNFQKGAEVEKLEMALAASEAESARTKQDTRDAERAAAAFQATAFKAALVSGYAMQQATSAGEVADAEAGRVRAKNDTLAAAVAALTAALVRTRNEKKDLREHNAASQAELARVKETKKGLKRDIDALRTELAHTKQENEALKTELARTKEENEVLKQAVAALVNAPEKRTPTVSSAAAKTALALAEVRFLLCLSG
jgi:chromosome segregation ATPase|tara:strand:+ start:173 stop:1219 length:1047 start_codon:yes stop_codon:yes gene_type:complete